MPDPADELVDVVDEGDHVLETVPRAEIRARRLLHRCTYALIRRTDGRIHVQRRTDTKDSCPGGYDMLPGGVVAAGETYDECVRRELAEELGIEGVDPVPVFMHRYSGPDGEAWGAVYEVTWDGPIRNQPEEVAWSGWATLDELDEMLRRLAFCDDSREVFARWRRT